MNIETIKSLFLKHKEAHLSHRYITNKHIAPLLKKLEHALAIEVVGKSVLNNNIH